MFEALNKSGILGITLGEEDTIKAYSEFIVSNGMYSSGEDKTIFEMASDAILKTIENGSTLVNLGSKK